jgi:hypothetical protein
MVDPGPSVFRDTLMFFERLGVYDVVLPFILIFTIVYAVLEKTKMLGTEKLEGVEYTRKNLNGMIALVLAFFVVASTQLVGIINEFIAHAVLLLVMAVLFMILVGSLHTGNKDFTLGKGWKMTFTIIMFVGIMLVFLNAIGWLPIIWEYLFFRFDSVAVSSLVLVAVVVGFIVYITSSPKKSNSNNNSSSIDEED